jgi:hypothetical protein
LLHRIYYAQREYAKKHGHPARTLADLRLGSFTHETLLNPPCLEVTRSGFEATVEIKPPGRKHARWHIRQDSRIWAD